ncbi:hypothetical protein [Clostridium sp. DL-VIII]|uniref:hypothetical protein n=1 Tax=Clostridium sp. DL-VIII TaxID=641107 RepID=UPI0002DA3B0F|nr:hypothetical protein [Clostridium sp. DL-VIII]
MDIRFNEKLNDFEDLDIIYTIDVVDFYKISKEELKNNIRRQGIVIFDKGIYFPELKKMHDRFEGEL